MESGTFTQKSEPERSKVNITFLIIAASILAFLPPFLTRGSLAGVFVIVAGYSFTVIFTIRLWHQFLNSEASLLRSIEMMEAEKQSAEQRLRDKQRLLTDSKAALESAMINAEAEKSLLMERVEQEGQKLAAAQSSLAEIQKSISSLHAENTELTRNRDEVIARRQVLQKQFFDLEQTANEIKTAHAARAEQHRNTLTELDKLGADLKKTIAAKESAIAETGLLAQKLDILQMELSNSTLREGKWKNEALENKSRLETTERNYRNLKSNTALQEELASRRMELERVYKQNETLTAQKDLANERAEILERERNDLNVRFSHQTVQLEEVERVINKLQDECRSARMEPRHEMSDHFAWKLNFFREQEVILDFTNGGISMDLIQIAAEPELSCQLLKPGTLARGKEARIKVVADKILPSEFVLKIRYTIFPQEASLKIRPFGETKIEMI